MSDDSRQSLSNLFTQVDITSSNDGDSGSGAASTTQQTVILGQILTALDRQNELLEELVTVNSSQQRQRQTELEQWKKANPQLARKCRTAAEQLSKAQSEFLHRLAEEVDESGEGLADGEFLLAEFVDRFGPRLAHLNGVLQVLTQLGVTPQASS